jgi:uncharacterized protein YndB with AHSA1/START domain
MDRSNTNEIVLTRVYDAPVRAVWDAWTVPNQVAQWWGPRGFTITTHSKDLRAGGSWRYTMHGPDGVDYPNVTHYFVVEPYRKLVYDHGASDDRPALFRVTVTFREADSKTTMHLIMSLSSPEAARDIARVIKQAGGNSTWDRLAEYLDQTCTGRQSFVINRAFDAPRARVFEMWTRPEHLASWLPPAGTTMRFLRPDIAVGKSALLAISGAHGTMHARFDYLTIEPPQCIVYTQQFVDEQEQPAPAPGMTVWPTTLRTTVRFVEETPERTRVTVTTEPEGKATTDEIEAFIRERAGMTVGWTGSFDVLETRLDPVSAG